MTCEICKKVAEWAKEIPGEALSPFPEDPIFIALIAARADNYRLAIRNRENDTFLKYEAMHQMISPNTLIDLCKAWQDLRRLEREREMEFEEE